eukprot:15464301-Alexandrium_andersonii.AAC.1
MSSCALFLFSPRLGHPLQESEKLGKDGAKAEKSEGKPPEPVAKQAKKGKASAVDQQSVAKPK